MSFDRPYFIEEMRADAQGLTTRQKNRNALRSQLNRNPANDLFEIKPADRWLCETKAAPARQLLGTLWHEHELCILFADTNLGKSVLAVQIGYTLAKETAVEPFANQVTQPLKVLYIDFELSAGQFKMRYSDSAGQLHHFGEDFIRAEFNPAGNDPLLYDKYDAYVREKIDNAIAATKAKVLIIDNITCIGSQTANAAGALPLMQNLKALKAKYNISVLVLAHTPKRKPYNPVTVNDLQGSKMLINFADSAIAIGQSCTNPALRYIKQIKQRNTASDYGADHICLFKLVKHQSFLSFEFTGYDNEQAHLQKPGTALSHEVKQRIAELNAQGLSSRQIAAHLKIGASTVKRILTKEREECSSQ